MPRPVIVFVIILIVAAAFYLAPPSTETLIKRCDQAAANPLDPDRPADIPGLLPEKIDPKTAVPACEAASKAAPDNSRMSFQLGQAYFISKDYTAAYAQYSKANVHHYLLAGYYFALMYRDGVGVPVDLDLARSLMTNAAAAGFAPAIQYLDTLPPPPQSLLPNPPQRSGGEDYLPADLDPDHKYKTYTYDELYNMIYAFPGDEDLRLGEKVKVFARYNPIVSYFGFNRTTRVVLPSFACQLEICDRMEGLADTVSSRELSRILKDIFIAVYFRDGVKYQDFKEHASKQCSVAYPCFLWATGTLRVVKADLKNFGIASTYRIVYVDVDQVRLYQGNENEILNGLKTGFWTGLSVGQFIVKLVN